MKNQPELSFEESEKLHTELHCNCMRAMRKVKDKEYDVESAKMELQLANDLLAAAQNNLTQFRHKRFPSDD